MNIERRAFVVDGLRVETREDGKRKIRGHAAVFNRLSEDLGGFREQISPGAFATAIVEDDVRALFNHDPNFVLGRNRSGTLTMSEDPDGLAVEIDPPDTQWARDLQVSIDRGDISQMSFGFRVDKGGQSWAKTDQGSIRTITKARLFDVSPVTFPAYPQTDVAVRELRDWMQSTQADDESRRRRARMRLALASRRLTA
jgi:HK97 family phage prohead protease